MLRILFSLIILALTAVPAMAATQGFFQQQGSQPGGFQTYFQSAFQRDGQNIFGVQGTAEETLPLAVGRIIRVVLSFVGVIMMLITVYAGYLWLTARGNEEQVTKAKMYIRNAIIGLVLSLSAYVITSFVVSRLERQLLRPGTGSEALDEAVIDAGGVTPGPLMDLPGSSGLRTG